MTYYTGIDVHKKSFVIQHMDEEGALGLSLSVQATKEGIDSFLAQLREPTVVTFEAGRSYWWLHEYLKNHPKVLAVNVVDPRRSRNISDELAVIRGYGRAKNDRIDSEMLAEQTRRNLAPKIYVPTPEQLKKRTVCRYRFYQIKSRTRVKNNIHSILAMYGVNTQIKTLLENEEAQQQIFSSLPSYVADLVDQFLAQIRLLNIQIECLDSQLEHLLPKSHPQIKLLMTAPGIGVVLARTIYTEIFDISYFKHYKYLISYSGLAPIISESSEYKDRAQLNRKSNHFLKYAFVEAAHLASDHIRYRRKYDLDVKRHGKIIAKLNLARRLAKTVYWMLTRQQPYRN